MTASTSNLVLLIPLGVPARDAFDDSAASRVAPGRAGSWHMVGLGPNERVVKNLVPARMQACQVVRDTSGAPAPRCADLTIPADGDAVIVPNNIVSKEPITNFSEPVGPTRLVVEVGVSYAAQPNVVKKVILDALRDASLVLTEPDTVAVFLFEDHKIARTTFLVPDNCRKVSTRAWLLFLEGRGWIGSAAEIERARRDGCDMAGMTALPEAGLARELGLDYAGLGVISNWGAGVRGEHLAADAFAASLHEPMARVRRLVGAVAELLSKGMNAR